MGEDEGLAGARGDLDRGLGASVELGLAAGAGLVEAASLHAVEMRGEQRFEPAPQLPGQDRIVEDHRVLFRISGAIRNRLGPTVIGASVKPLASACRISAAHSSAERAPLSVNSSRVVEKVRSLWTAMSPV